MEDGSEDWVGVGGAVVGEYGDECDGGDYGRDGGFGMMVFVGW